MPLDLHCSILGLQQPIGNGGWGGGGWTDMCLAPDFCPNSGVQGTRPSWCQDPAAAGAAAQSRLPLSTYVIYVAASTS